ncbi:hypothetical protein B0A49_01589 [Cryomyces minteri]|uniref:AB hydrolase-1 domain-containing protein n=1 Tax=Cryomyces minteri TaxID=331657 RepID=A0A4U0XWN6_9PEZI|nr:hypothetical protein B0A49_01589 [Cryomyces minteri]
MLPSPLVKVKPHVRRDQVLQPTFHLIRFVLSFTAVRLLSILLLAPTYVAVKALTILPQIIGEGSLVLTQAGREELIRRTDSYRRKEEHQARQQLNGTFRFQQAQLVSARKHAIRHKAGWSPSIEDFEVCGARVNVVHETPQPGRSGGRGGRQTIVLLHGNPEWSYKWRDIIPILTQEGYEVFALDWLGHGLSDKPIDASTISFELHMNTLISLFEHFDIQSCCIVADGWGGCIATCTAPYLPTTRQPRIFLLDSFFPRRAPDSGLHCYMLHLLCFVATGILNGYLAEAATVRYLAPGTASSVVRGYSAPYVYGGIRTKASIIRFSHLAPLLPDVFLFKVRESAQWRTLEGLCGPDNFTNINAQALLADRDRGVKAFWKRCTERGWKVCVVSGERGPLLGSRDEAVTEHIDRGALVEVPRAVWMEEAGHYSCEEGPKTVAKHICRFLEVTRPRT